MDDKDRTDRENESRQSGAGGDVAYGQKPESFGAGGQVTQSALEPGRDDAPDRDPARDESLPEEERDPGIGKSKGAFMAGADPADIGDEADVEDDSAPGGGVDPAKLGRTNP